MFSQNSAGVGGVAEAGDGFGMTLAAGSFNRDGFSDLAIGVPGEGVGIEQAAGAANVLYGAANGLTTVGSRTLSQSSYGIVGRAEAGDEFAGALAAGDFDGDGIDDLAIGVAGEDIGSIPDAGSVAVVYGSVFGLSSARSAAFHQNTAGVYGVAEAGDRFGAALAHGDHDGDGLGDLVVGVGFEDVGANTDAGSLTLLFGSPGGGLTVAGDIGISQGNPGVPGAVESDDGFARTLLTDDFDADGRADIAIGAPFEDHSCCADVGVFIVLPGGTEGPDYSRAAVWHQNSPGVLGGGEPGDRFGWLGGNGSSGA